MTVHMYGIANCDTIRKARKWLMEHNIACTFHDYKKEGVNAALLKLWSMQLGWETLLNKRGTTWRNLPDEDKQNLNEKSALALLCKHPSMIKRPILVVDEHIEVGFSAAAYKALFQ